MNPFSALPAVGIAALAIAMVPVQATAASEATPEWLQNYDINITFERFEVEPGGAVRRAYKGSSVATRNGELLKVSSTMLVEDDTLEERHARVEAYLSGDQLKASDHGLFSLGLSSTFEEDKAELSASEWTSYEFPYLIDPVQRMRFFDGVSVKDFLTTAKPGTSHGREVLPEGDIAESRSIDAGNGAGLFVVWYDEALRLPLQIESRVPADGSAYAPPDLVQRVTNFTYTLVDGKPFPKEVTTVISESCSNGSCHQIIERFRIQDVNFDAPSLALAEPSVGEGSGQ